VQIKHGKRREKRWRAIAKIPNNGTTDFSDGTDKSKELGR